jgi:hypothetical protein
VSLPLTWERKQIQFPKCRVLWRWTKCYTPSSEPFRIYIPQPFQSSPSNIPYQIRKIITFLQFSFTSDSPNLLLSWWFIDPPQKYPSPCSGIILSSSDINHVLLTGDVNFFILTLSKLHIGRYLQLSVLFVHNQKGKERKRVGMHSLRNASPYKCNH